MAVWQFIVIAALIGSLLIYMRVLTNRIGCTNATLKRIEEALLVTDRLRGHAPTAAAEVTQVPEVTGKDRDAGYLTIRDLKVMPHAARSSRRNSVASNPESCDALSTGAELPISSSTLPVGGEFVAASPGSGDAVNMSGELQNPPDIDAVDGGSVVPRSKIRDALDTSVELPNSASTPLMNGEFVASSVESGELLRPPDAFAVNGEFVAGSSESRDALNPSGESQPSPSACAVNGDSEEKRKRDALLFLSNQRRRRRAR